MGTHMRITQLLNSYSCLTDLFAFDFVPYSATKASALMFSDRVVASGSACFVCPVVTTSHGVRVESALLLEHWRGGG